MKKKRIKEVSLLELIQEASLSNEEKDQIWKTLRELDEKIENGAKRIDLFGLLSIINKTAYKSDKYGWKK